MSAVHDLISKLIAKARASHPDRPALIGVGGAQGSGKSTLCRAYAAAHAGVAHFSLDDVYLTKAERAARAEAILASVPEQKHKARVRALLVTRGPPGTHDLGLADAVIVALGKPGVVALPRFDKLADERASPEAWPSFAGPAEAILIDGWCIGARVPPRLPPLNDVEQEDIISDEMGCALTPWRDSFRAALANEYFDFFSRFDAMIYLQAPSWQIVRTWRGQQEEAMLGRPLNAEENASLDRFVQHYEMLTASQIGARNLAHWLVHLDDERAVVKIEQNPYR